MGKFNLDIPKMGYIILFKYDKKHFNLFGEGIYRKQLSMGFDEEDALYTHIAISSGGPHLVNVMPPKAKLIHLPTVYKGTYVKFLSYTGVGFDFPIRYKVACLYNALAGNIPYDWRGVASFMIPFIRQLDSKFFCSEACCEAFQMIYPEALNYMLPEKSMPATFAASKQFLPEWEGVIS